MTVLSLCDYSGVWSKPYKDAGYDVMQVDLQHDSDVRLFQALPFPVRGVLAAPPCAEFAGSGARWWESKGEQKLLDGLALVDACCRIVLVHRPQWWVIENPVGRLNRWLGEAQYIFDPADYGGYAGGEGDDYLKRTCLWGRFNAPMKAKIEAVRGSLMLKFSEHMPDRGCGQVGDASRFCSSILRGKSMTQSRLTIIPVTWRRAREFCEIVHRHHGAPQGHKFALGVVDEAGALRGVAICGRPIARHFDDGLTIEVNRTATDGCSNANSALYGACWRVAAAMGYRRIVTYTQEHESGSSLRAAGYRHVRELPARGSWSAASVALRHLRDEIGSGGVQRALWERVA